MSTDVAIDQLVAAQRAVAVPFVLPLRDAAPLEVTATLRLLPGKRLSARGEWSGRTVMAKLLVRQRGGDRHAAAELQGQRAIADAGIATPALLWHGLSACGRIAVVLYEYLADAVSLAEIYERGDTPQRAAALAAMFSATAQLHAHQALQTDPHLDNFLWRDGALWLIDAGSLQRQASALARNVRERNLALLLAQFPLKDQDNVAAWCAAYNAAGARHGLAALDSQRQQRATAQAWRLRGENVLAKAQRECSATCVQHTWRRFVAYRRADADATLLALLTDIDGAMTAAHMLKDGNSATVVRVVAGARQWVIKRYNMKSWTHRLRRCLRPSRAMQSWRNAHLLQFACIATPAPVAVIEERFGPLRGRAWFISEYLPGTEMLDAYRQRAPQENEMQQTLAIFEAMQRALISHGDLKAQNLMIGDDGVVRLIDLDAMRWHRSVPAWRARFNADVRRFLRNWDGELRTRFVTLLRAVAPEVCNG